MEPGPTPDRRSACSGMDARVANAASSGGTRSGTTAHSRPGTAWNSAWLALPAPPVATSWPGRDPVDGGADLSDHPGRGVAEGHVGGEPAPDRPRRGRDALGLGLAHDLADQVRPGACLGEQARSGERGDRPFGTRGDHRGHGADQHLGRADHRARNVEHLDRTAADRLHDLLHAVPSPSARPRARLQTVLTRTGRAASIRQVSTGASTVLPNPAATGLISAASGTGAACRHGHRESPGRAGDQRHAVGDPYCRPRRQLPADDDLVPAPPGDQVLDPQPVAGQRPPATMTGAAGQPPEPVMDRLERDRRRADPGRPGR